MTREILKTLKESGYKITPQRREIIRILCSASRPQSAYEIYRGVQGSFPEVSLDTVYRNLRLLCKLGLALQIAAGSAHSDLFELSTDHHHHLVCVECGLTYCLPGCPLAGLEVGEFKVLNHVLEVYGLCADCQEKEQEPSRPPESTED